MPTGNEEDNPSTPAPFALHPAAPMPDRALRPATHLHPFARLRSSLRRRLPLRHRRPPGYRGSAAMGSYWQPKATAVSCCAPKHNLQLGAEHATSRAPPAATSPATTRRHAPPRASTHAIASRSPRRSRHSALAEPPPSLALVAATPIERMADPPEALDPRLPHRHGVTTSDRSEGFVVCPILIASRRKTPRKKGLAAAFLARCRLRRRRAPAAARWGRRSGEWAARVFSPPKPPVRERRWEGGTFQPLPVF